MKHFELKFRLKYSVRKTKYKWDSVKKETLTKAEIELEKQINFIKAAFSGHLIEYKIYEVSKNRKLIVSGHGSYDGWPKLSWVVHR